LCLDREANADQSLRGARDISTAESRARILVIPTNEELLIARDTAALTGGN
jgi:acetate kinase